MPGDKIRVRTGDQAGARGCVAAVFDGLTEVQLESGSRLVLRLADVTNFSLAARKAWETMPKRAGRPKLLRPPRRMVSMRIDSDVWESLGAAVRVGLIVSREQAINDWLRAKVTDLLKDRPRSSAIE